MKLNKFAYLYSKTLGNHTLKIMKKIPGNLLKNLEISWNFVSPKSGNPVTGSHKILYSEAISETDVCELSAEVLGMTYFAREMCQHAQL